MEKTPILLQTTNETFNAPEGLDTTSKNRQTNFSYNLKKTNASKEPNFEP